MQSENGCFWGELVGLVVFCGVKIANLGGSLGRVVILGDENW
jgi:hypothetical protein